VAICDSLVGQFWLILSHHICNWDIVLLIGISLYRNTMTGSQELGSEFNKIVLKFLSVMSTLRALTYKSLFLMMVIWFLS